MFNPFPGLRPFEPEEDHLFFGREKEIDELLRRLRATRFLSIIGTSGSGKSSLVRCGLISALHGGFMAKAGSGWRVAKFRPSEDPIGNLAASLSAPDALGSEQELASTNRVLLEATLRRGTLGLVDAVRFARIPPDENLLVVVDQFEELFRFRHSRHPEDSGDEATAFVKLLLEATQQEEVPIYVVLTMRSDFIGECMEYPGLPEALTAGQYLIRRLTRNELRSAITAPVAVAGGEIAPRLVLRLLNDLGDDHDQLPVLQHALMRTWEHWAAYRQADEPLDLADYEAVGTLRHALSAHLEEAYQETASAGSQIVAERIFKALTDTFSDPRGVRRPASVHDLAAICDAPEATVMEVIENFRRPGRSFLTPPATTSLNAHSIVDLSHESLMRCWTRLIEWAREERESARLYVRLSQAASWFAEGTAGLWRDPELELLLKWRRKNQPTPAWAERYNPSFSGAMEFLNRSEGERNRIAAEQERQRKRKLKDYQLAAGILSALLAITGYLAYTAYNENKRAENNLQLAQKAVDELLSSAGSGRTQVTEDVPQLEEFRKELLVKAKNFFSIFTTEKPNSPALRRGTAGAYFSLGEIDRLLHEPQAAAQEYRQAVSEFEILAKKYPAEPDYRQALANTYNWLGEALRTQPETRSEADTAYQSALLLQQELARQHPGNNQYVRELARTHSNRGILRYSNRDFAGSESEFRAAVQLLAPLAAKDPGSPAAQELARVYNNLGILLSSQERTAEAREFDQRAIDLDAELLKRNPDEREYGEELATLRNNLAILMMNQGQFSPALDQNAQSIGLMQDLARPAPALGMQLAQAYNVRCRSLLQLKEIRNAELQCDNSMELLNSLEKIPSLRGMPDFQKLFLDLGYNYGDLGRKHLKAGEVAQARSNFASLSRLLPQISEPNRSRLMADYREAETQAK